MVRSTQEFPALRTLVTRNFSDTPTWFCRMHTERVAAWWRGRSVAYVKFDTCSSQGAHLLPRVVLRTNLGTCQLAQIKAITPHWRLRNPREASTALDTGENRRGAPATKCLPVRLLSRIRVKNAPPPYFASTLRNEQRGSTAKTRS